MSVKNIEGLSGGKISVLCSSSGGDVKKNLLLMDNIEKGSVTDLIIKTALQGTPLIEIGKGSPKVMIVAGIHGNELPPQLATLKLIEYLKNVDLKGKIYLIPFSSPKSTMENIRWFKGFDLNRSCSHDGSLGNLILKVIQSLRINAVADFHSTKPKSNPGRESVFCSKEPCIDSYYIANYITKNTFSELICYDKAGSMYQGALEDECNLRNIPSVTCEVVSENGVVKQGSIERSFLQMKVYLEYFRVLP